MRGAWHIRRRCGMPEKDINDSRSCCSSHIVCCSCGHLNTYSACTLVYVGMCVCALVCACLCVCHLSSSFFYTFAFALANSFAFISIVAKCNQITLMFPLMSFTLTLKATTATTIADNNDNNEATHCRTASSLCCLPQLLDFSASLSVSQLLNRVSVRLISSCQLSLFSACFHFRSFPPSLRQLTICGNCCVCPCQCKKSEHNVLPGIFIGLTTLQRLQGITKCKAHSQSSGSSD